jgi:beta-lactamase regulating signal transducer with metallopeptidase domain
MNALLQMSVFSAFLLIAILSLRAALKKHASPVMIYALWSLLIIRLLLPVTFESKTKLFVFEREPDAVAYEETNEQPNATAADMDTQPNMYGIEGEAMHDAAPPDDYAEDIPPAAGVPTVSKTQRKSSVGILDYFKALDYSFYVLALWIAVAAVMLSNIAVSAISLRRHLIKESLGVYRNLNKVIIRCKKELGIKNNIRTVVIDGLASPSITASLRPIIVVPKELLEDSSSEKLEFSIRHELMHFKRGDHIAYLLIGIIKAVYWFNPVVYIMNKYMKMDMETACDSMVVKDMNDRVKVNYAATILDMYAKRHGAPVALGMAIETTKKSAERRIRGIYMRHKSNKLAKVLTALIALIMIFACFTTACVPEASEPDIVEKTQIPESTPLVQNETEDIAEPAAEVKSFEPIDYETPETLKYTLESDKEKFVLKVDVDAQIIVPDYALPIVEVKPVDLTYEQVNNVAQLISQGKPMYDSGDAEFIRTQIKILDQIEYYEKEIEMSTPDMKDHIDFYEKTIKELKEEYKSAPASYAEAVFVPAEEILEHEVFVEGDEAPTPTPMPTGLDTSGRIAPVVIDEAGFGSQNYYLDIDEANYPDSLRIVLTDDIKQTGIYYKKTRMPWETSIRPRPESYTSLEGFDFTLEQAEALAAPYVEALDTGMTLNEYSYAIGSAHVGDDYEYTPEGYVLYYTPVYEGVAARYAEPSSLEMPSLLEATGEIPRAEPYPQEYLAITVLKDGVSLLEYYNPSEQVNVIESDAEILPFDEIKKSFDEYIMGLSNESGSIDYRSYITVNRIELSLMRIQTPETNEYKMIPVWDFYGGSWKYYLIGEEYESRYNEFYGRSYVTINALDGSIVDRETGY